MIVLDASAVLEFLLRTPAGDIVRDRIASVSGSIHAPHFIDLEVAQVLRRFQAAGSLSPMRGRQALEILADLRLRRYPHTPFLPRVWELRHNLTAYDAVYVAMAEALDAPLVTYDRRIRSAPGHRARVELLPR